MEVLDRLRRAARRCQATIVFPEGSDTRILRAAAFLACEGIARPILLGALDQVQAAADGAQIRVPESVEIVNPATSNNRLEFAKLLRTSGGLGAETYTMAAQAVQDPLIFGALLVRTGQADGCVAGAAHPTTRVLQAGLRVCIHGTGAVAEQHLAAVAGNVQLLIDASVAPEIHLINALTANSAEPDVAGTIEQCRVTGVDE